MVAYQRKAKLRIHKKVGSQVGGGGAENMILSFFLFFFLGPYSQHMQVPRLGVKSELQPPAYTTATEKPDLSRVFDLQTQLTALPDP